MTNRLTPNAKNLLAAALTASAVLGLSACNSSAAKPSAAAPSTTQQSSAPANGSTAQPSVPTASQPTTTTESAQNANPNQTATPTKTQTQPQAPAPKTTAANPTPKSPKTTPATLPAACTPDHLKGTVTTLNRPINHVLLTVTNTGSTTCDLYYYPDLRFDADQQAVTQAVEDSKPQAVVTIAPGESGYAAIGTSAGDGSGGTPKLEKQVEVYLETRDQSGSLPGSLTLALPAGTYVDDKAFVTYWQSDLQSAVAW